MRFSVIIFTFLFAFSAQAKVEAMFHPYEPTFVKIVDMFKSAKKTIDIALYNIDSSKNNPVVAFLASAPVQKKIKSKKLKVRLLFEGYAHKDENMKKMLKFEDLGIDVRHMKSSRKMHHKFAVIDGGTKNSKLINGSANWSLNSRDFYNENILYFENHINLTASYQDEFNFLWSLSREVGFATDYKVTPYYSKTSKEGVKAYFNTENFIVKNDKLYKSKTKEGFHLTKQLVRMIDDADDTILIATTRLKLRPVFNALLRAAERGVKIKLVVTMGEYVHKSYRKKLDLPECPDEFHSSCSSGVNYSIHLSRENFPGSENVDVRLKFFHMNTKAYLDKQMHSKYMIIDNETIMTGSFNWSYSAEFKHVENIMEIDGYEYPEILLSFNSDFDELWDLERGLYKGLVADYERDLKKKKKIDCSFEPMTLKFSEIDFLLATPYRAAKKRSLKYVCK